jgi:hypothetical protein
MGYDDAIFALLKDHKNFRGRYVPRKAIYDHLEINSEAETDRPRMWKVVSSLVRLQRQGFVRMEHGLYTAIAA